MKWPIPALMAFVMLSMVLMPATEADGENGTPDMLLLDHGNGDYAWYEMGDASGTLLSAISTVLDANGISYETHSDAFTSVDGRTNCVVGTQECGWRIYLWDSYQWSYGEPEGDRGYAGGNVAIGFYPDYTQKPVPTPYYRDSWTSYRGSSSNAGISQSFGPEKIATPLEWYLGSGSGGLYSSILWADGLMYYVTGGSTEGDGVNRSPHLYCVDSVNKEVAWYFTYSLSPSKNNQQFEIDTPVIIGDMIVVTSANRHIYCLDRFDGEVLSELVPEGEKPHYANSYDTTEYTYSSTTGMHGSMYANGPTTAVYDSGALYFNTHDGTMHCYSVNRDEGFKELWKCTPDLETRGCFYFSPPTVTHVDGTRVVVSGSHSGYIYCVDADTGTVLRSSKIGVLDNGATVAVSRIVPADENHVLASADDGEISPKTGFTVKIDLRDLSVDWKLDLFGGMMAVVDDKAYMYLKASLRSSDPAYEKPQIWDKNGTYSDAESGFFSISLADGHVIWSSPNNAYTKSGIVFCDGRLYCADYNTTFNWPNGGAVRCIDPDNGRQIWAVKMDPGTSGAYCMSTPTVIEGKVYIGNDDGTLYCISDIPGTVDPHSDRIQYDSVGLTHWSWLLLFAVLLTTIGTAVIAYRR